MAFGSEPVDSNGVPVSSVYVPGTGFIALKGSTNTNTDGSGNQSAPAAMSGDYTETASLAAGSLNADLVASVDVSYFKWFSVQVTGTWVGTLTFQGSNDNSNWVSVTAFAVATPGTAVSTATANGLYVGPVTFRYLRIRMTAYTSGTANGTLEAYTFAATGFGGGSGGGGGGTSSSFGAAFPATGTASGGIAKTTLPSAASDGNMTGFMLDKFGRIVVVEHSVRDLKSNIPGLTLTSTTETTLISAGGAGVFNDITGIIVINTSASAVRVDFRDSTAGTIQFPLYVPAGDTRGFSGLMFKQGTANNAWTAQLSGAVTDVRIAGTYVANK